MTSIRWHVPWIPHEFNYLWGILNFVIYTVSNQVGIFFFIRFHAILFVIKMKQLSIHR